MVASMTRYFCDRCKQETLVQTLYLVTRRQLMVMYSSGLLQEEPALQLDSLDFNNRQELCVSCVEAVRTQWNEPIVTGAGASSAG